MVWNCIVYGDAIGLDGVQLFGGATGVDGVELYSLW